MIVIDLETTGLTKPGLSDLKQQPYITEFYAAKLTRHFDLIDELEMFVKPPVPIPEIVTKITGITDDTVAGAAPFPVVFKYIAKFFVGEMIVVAHNAPFDLGVLRYEMMRIGMEFNFPWPMYHLCTVEGSRHIENKRLKLAYLHKLATGKEHVNAHRAKSDVFALIRCFEWLIKNDHMRLPND